VAIVILNENLDLPKVMDGINAFYNSLEIPTDFESEEDFIRRPLLILT